MKKELKTADELSRMIQNEVDPKFERGRFTVFRIPSPLGFDVMMSSSSTCSDTLYEAKKAAERLSSLYELDKRQIY
ncbi:hypothetical protein [Brucella sp. 22210]|uniref:hypothetical protein n=1 Tax=Brucella sp. 22210 TaxID=3453892 RepID=UPI003F824276